MALGAFPRLDGRVLALAGSQSLCQVRMTGEAERSLLLGHDSLEIAPVGIMAGQTHPFLKRIMGRPACRFFHQAAVALGAEL